MNEISKEQLLYMKRTRQHKQFVLFFQLFLFIFFIILWEITSRAGIINAFIFSKFLHECLLLAKNFFLTASF